MHKRPTNYSSGRLQAALRALQDEILGEALFESRQMKDYIELMKAGIKEQVRVEGQKWGKNNNGEDQS